MRSLKKMIGYSAESLDGKIGEVDNFYFDTPEWFIRYAVIETGGLLNSKRVLISPESFGEPLWQERKFPISLSKEKIENSPTVEEKRPITMQEEENLIDYYGWDTYWGLGPYVNLHPRVLAPIRHIPEYVPEDNYIRDSDNSILKGLYDIEGFSIHASDGVFGRVEDIIIEDESWIIRYLVIDTRRYLPSKKVLIAPEWIEMVNWSTEEIYVDLEKETIKDTPVYDPDAPIDRAYEEKLYDYHEYARYWEDKKEEINA